MTTKADLSSYIRDFLGGGEGYLLDCFMQEPAYSAELEPFAKRLFGTHERYSNAQYPIGLGNPEAETELREILRELEGS